MKHSFNFNQNIYNKNVHVINPHGIGDVVMMVPLVAEILSYNPKQLSFTLKSKLEAEVLTLFFPEQKFKIIFLKNIYENSYINSPLVYISNLRKLSIQSIFTAYGVNSQQGSIVSLLSGASVRIGWRNILGVMNTISLAPEFGLHKVNKNLRLLNEYSDKLPVFPSTLFHSDQGMLDKMRHKLDEVNVDVDKDYMIAIAPGSGERESHKRWPIEK